MSDSAVAKKSKKQVFFSRLLSTVIMWALVTWVFIAQSELGFSALLALLSFGALFEILKMGGGKIPRMTMWVTLVISLAYMGIESSRSIPQSSLMLGSLGLLTLLAFGVSMRKAPEGDKTLLEVLVPLVAFVLVPVMFYSSSSQILFTQGDLTKGAWLMLWLVAVTKFSDMGAYITGSLVGKTKMIPHISPGKTWEGLVGGFAFTQLAACGLYAMAPDQLSFFSGWGEVVILGFVLCAVAVVGDLAESVLKRSLVVKDSGATLPGIGGILDLIDSICFTAPVFALWMGIKEIF